MSKLFGVIATTTAGCEFIFLIKQLRRQTLEIRN